MVTASTKSSGRSEAKRLRGSRWPTTTRSAQQAWRAMQRTGSPEHSVHGGRGLSKGSRCIELRPGLGPSFGFAVEQHRCHLGTERKRVGVFDRSRPGGVKRSHCSTVRRRKRAGELHAPDRLRRGIDVQQDGFERVHEHSPVREPKTLRAPAGGCVDVHQWQRRATFRL
jgi:hypothetical protein